MLNQVWWKLKNSRVSYGLEQHSPVLCLLSVLFLLNGSQAEAQAASQSASQAESQAASQAGALLLALLVVFRMKNTG
jgi:hypothetical protein